MNDKIREVLEDRINFRLGDLLIMTNTKGSVAGYVTDFTPETVTLSHQRPITFHAFEDSGNPSGYKSFFKGNRTYRLEHFIGRKVIIPYSRTEDSDL